MAPAGLISKTRLSLPRNAITRILLIPVGVLVGLYVNLEPLRWATTEVILLFIKLMNIEYYPFGEYAFKVGDSALMIGMPCTSFSAFLGVLPIIWSRKRGLLNSLLSIGIFFVAFEFLNALRIAVGLFFFDLGFSWNITHTIPSGFFYAALLHWALRKSEWIRPG